MSILGCLADHQLPVCLAARGRCGARSAPSAAPIPARHRPSASSCVQLQTSRQAFLDVLFLAFLASWHCRHFLNRCFSWPIMTSTDASIESSEDSKPFSDSSVEEPCHCSFGDDRHPQYIALPDDTDTEDSYKDAVSRFSSETSSLVVTVPPARRFSRWMSSLRRRTVQRHLLSPQTTPFLVDLNGRPQLLHRDSSSGSSFGFVAGVKSATVSVSSTAIVKSAGRSIRTPLGRSSEDSLRHTTPTDRLSIERALRRRRILEELIQTEEGYIGDIRLLMNASVALYCRLTLTVTGVRYHLCRLPRPRFVAFSHSSKFVRYFTPP